nr:radical SAM protein [Candidatus Gracilibacteria bacterium]
MQEKKPFKLFTLQWHITNACQLRCKHCYVDFSKPVALDFNSISSGIDNYISFLRKYNIEGKVYFTGGDPWLYPKFKDIVEYSLKNGLKVSLFGNYHLLTDKNIAWLKEKGINFYQLSIEGLENKHEEIRGKGTFKEVVKAIEKLENNNIQSLVNMTVSKWNINEVIPLIEYLARNTKLSRFDFVRVVPMGKASKNIMVTNSEFKDLLLKILKVEEKLKSEKCKLQIGKKDHLWKLLYYENNKLNIDLDDKVYGCGMGYRHLTVIENGDVLLCRKLPIKIGNITENSLIDIYENSLYIDKIHKGNLIKGCLKCKLKNVCRGCPAVNYGLYKNFNKIDSQCWIK